VFWSDDEGRNRARAEAFGIQQREEGHSAYTLEQTTYGSRLDAQKLFEDPTITNADARRIWRDTSLRYTNEASGNVDTFVVGAAQHSVFRDAEMPAALNNAQVSSINGVSREELAGLYHKDPEACFNRICEAELERDRQRSTNDPALAEDVAKRDKLYRETLALQGRTAEEATEIRDDASRAEAKWSGKAEQAQLGKTSVVDLQAERNEARNAPSLDSHEPA
jgi:hypothetical protein